MDTDVQMRSMKSHLRTKCIPVSVIVSYVKAEKEMG